tara:strand:+ start:7670 stop:8458 length:789 start_codon:yes stop_codon:yes gene_type:complete
MVPARSLTFTFGGGAWYVMFYLGVAQYVSEHVKPDLKPLLRFAGCSAGSCAATALALNINPGKLSNDLIMSSDECKWNILRTCDVVQAVAEANVPFDDAVCTSVSDRLLIGMTEYKYPIEFKKANKRVFSGRDDILLSLNASCNIPVLGGISPVVIDGKMYYDANISHNWTCLPIFTYSDKIIRVTTKNSWYLNNGRNNWISPRLRIPLSWQLFPPEQNSLRKLNRLGYLRAWEYLDTYEKYFFDSPDDSLQLKHELDNFQF